LKHIHPSSNDENEHLLSLRLTVTSLFRELPQNEEPSFDFRFKCRGVSKQGLANCALKHSYSADVVVPQEQRSISGKLSPGSCQLSSLPAFIFSFI